MRTALDGITVSSDLLPSVKLLALTNFNSSSWRQTTRNAASCHGRGRTTLPSSQLCWRHLPVPTNSYESKRDERTTLASRHRTDCSTYLLILSCWVFPVFETRLVVSERASVSGGRSQAHREEVSDVILSRSQLLLA